MHRRKEIREMLVTAIKGETLAGDRVFDSRTVNAGEGELPAISVFGGSESVDRLCSSPVVERRTYEIEIKVLVASMESEAEVEQQLDAIASKLEEILGKETLGGLVENLTLTGTAPERRTSGQFFGSNVLTYEANYQLEEH